MSEVPIKALQEALFDLHGCESNWVQAAPVKETFQGQTVWEGTVQVFELQGHPTATRCYAVSHLVGDSEHRRFVAVLHVPPMDSPEGSEGGYRAGAKGGLV